MKGNFADFLKRANDSTDDFEEKGENDQNLYPQSYMHGKTVRFTVTFCVLCLGGEKVPTQDIFLLYLRRAAGTRSALPPLSGRPVPR